MTVSNVSIGHDEVTYANAVARRFFRDPQDAADAAQDALLAAHRHLGSYRGEARLTTWLHRIVVTTALGHLRKRGRRPPVASVEADGADELASPAPSPEALVADAEVASRVREVLHGLGDKYDQVFRLRFVDDLAETEVARALHLTVSTVKIRTYRARRAVRTALAQCR